MEGRDKVLWGAAYAGNLTEFTRLFTPEDTGRWYQGVTLLHAVMRGVRMRLADAALPLGLEGSQVSNNPGDRNDPAAIVNALLANGADLDAVGRAPESDAADNSWGAVGRTPYELSRVHRPLGTRMAGAFLEAVFAAPGFADMDLAPGIREIELAVNAHRARIAEARRADAPQCSVM